MTSAPWPARSQPERDALSDDALGSLAQAGDVEAFACLYDRHAPLVLALLGRMLGNASEAEDLLHDVFLEAWQSVRTFDRSRASVRTWLFVRARSRALDRLQRRSREPRAQDALELASLPRAPLGGGHAERALAVRAALDALDPVVRETLELTYYAGMTAKEIGERMGVPVGTVRSRLARGLQALASALKGGEGA